MATYTKSTGQAGTMRIIVTYSQSTSNNQTTFSYRYELSNSWSSTYAYGKSWNSSSAGSNHSGTFDINGVQTITIRSGTRTITHNSDGSLSNQTFSWTMGATGTSGLGGPTTFSKSISVPTIPRATQPATPDLEAGEAGTISLPRASSSFTHQLRYSFGSLSSQTSGIGNSSTAGTSTSWTPPMSLLNQIPNATSGTGTMTATTKNGSTTIGAKSDSFKVTAPASVVPSFTGYSHSDSNTAVATEVDAYVQGLSVLNLSITGAAGIYNSTISPQGYTYQIGSLTSTVKTASGTMSQPIVDQDTVALTFTVTDSRGRTYSEGENVTVLPYVNPTLNFISVVRASDSGGTEAPDSGTYIRVNMDANVASLINGTQRNELSYKIETAPTGSSTWTDHGTVTPGGITFAGQDTVGAGFSIASSYQVRLTIADKFNSIQATRTVPTAKVPFDVAEEGTGHGKVHQQGSVDASGEIYHRNGGLVQPAGTIVLYAGSTAPAGWFMCDGGTKSRTADATLYGVIGTTYGAGDGSTTYNLPDLRSRVPTGYDSGNNNFNALGKTGGSETHNHDPGSLHATMMWTGNWLRYKQSGSSSWTPTAYITGMSSGSSTSSQTIGLDTVGSTGSTSSLAPYVTLNYIIKA